MMSEERTGVVLLWFPVWECECVRADVVGPDDLADDGRREVVHEGGQGVEEAHL